MTRPAAVRRTMASRIPVRGSGVITGASEDPATVIPACRHDRNAYSWSAWPGNASANPSPRPERNPGWLTTTIPSSAARAASAGYIAPPCSMRCLRGFPGVPASVRAYASSTISIARSPWA